jgi:uncharacterized membrane protein (DUF4010 family)
VPQAGAAVLSCVATMLQILVVAATVQPAWLAHLWLPALCGALVAGAWGWWQVRGTALAQGDAGGAAGHSQLPEDSPMFKLRDAAVIVLLLTAIQVGVQALTRWLGDTGMLVGALLASLADVHAATAAVLVRGAPTADASSQAIAQALMAALLVHAVSKSAVALASGGWRYALAVVPGILGHTLAFVLPMALMG